MSQENENTFKDTAFCHLQKRLVIDMVKKIMENATKTVKNVRMFAAKTASKRAVQKTAETTGDLIGKKIANKFSSAGKSKSKKSKQNNEVYKTHEIYMPLKKYQQIINDSRLNIKYQKIIILLGNKINTVPQFSTKTWVEDQLLFWWSI